ncbi:MAG: hypothetical protein EBU33_06865, partial [Sphingobacteriia bacterium]|nr:hypothetical protein [Sphingobacteriia bacterium]
MVVTKPSNRKKKDILSLLSWAVIILLANFIGSYAFKRFDLTSEKRYTLASSTRQLLAKLD